MRYLAFITLLLSNLLHADDLQVKIPRSLCEDVDVQDTNPNLKEFFQTPRSQDNIG